MNFCHDYIKAQEKSLNKKKLKQISPIVLFLKCNTLSDVKYPGTYTVLCNKMY